TQTCTNRGFWGLAMISKLLRWTAVCCLIIFSLGFRTFSSQKTFAVNNSSPAKTKIFLDFDQASVNLTNDLPSGDPLANTNPITVSTAVDSVMTDFNSISAAYVQLVGTGDSDYAAESTNRVITIRKAGTEGLSGGEASLEYKDSVVTGCTIIIKPDVYEKASQLITAITHEVGHCLGLDHPQETVNAVMSYFSNGAIRLQIDDKMGISFLYPTDPTKAKENPTMGLSCARAN
ncbi:MAG: matrixin family metalloprotease, partial [Bdellovibrionales bacterium]|nr:matrixin family metalloprotease [Bdellovibrionales bacterium]